MSRGDLDFAATGQDAATLHWLRNARAQSVGERNGGQIFASGRRAAPLMQIILVSSESPTERRVFNSEDLFSAPAVLSCAMTVHKGVELTKWSILRWIDGVASD